MIGIEQIAQDELECTLDTYFPKGGGQNRAGALMLLATAMTIVRKMIRAFGGCTTCYGKGYATITNNGMRMNFCACERGMQLDLLVSG